MTLARSFWTRDSPLFPGLPEFMEVNPMGGWILATFVVTAEPVRNGPMWMRYKQVADGKIQTQLRSDAEWRPYEYRIEDGKIYWIFNDSEQEWASVSLDKLPLWYQPMKLKQLEKNGLNDKS